jgi:hypothetical protein
MDKDDFLIYTDFANLNHIMQHNGGSGSFNPCSMIMFAPNITNPLISNLIFQHEFAHARLSSCIYGKIVFFFRFIALDLVTFCFQKGKPINKYWVIYEQLQRITSILLKNWIITQEGNATFTEIKHLSAINSPSLFEYQEQIYSFLKKDSPYSLGLAKIDRISRIYPKSVFRNIIHQLGNIDYTLVLPNLIKNVSNEEHNLPDLLLEKIVLVLDNEKENKSILIEYEKDLFIMKQESEIICRFAQKIIQEKLNVSFYDDNEKSLIHDLVKIVDENIDLYEYKCRIWNVLSEYESLATEQLKNGGPTQILAYNTKQINRIDNFSEYIFTDKFVTEQETNSINYLVNLDKIIKQDLPNNELLFSKNLNSLQSKFHQNYNFLLRIFPPTEDFRFKESNYNKYLNFDLFKVRKKIINNAKIFLMNQIQVKCTPSEAKDMESQFKQANRDFSILIDSELPEEGFGHWIETASVMVTIIASTITIIDTIKKWLKNDKEERIVIIGKIEYNTVIDKKLIDEELDKMERIIIENKEDNLKI